MVFAEESALPRPPRVSRSASASPAPAADVPAALEGPPAPARPAPGDAVDGVGDEVVAPPPAPGPAEPFRSESAMLPDCPRPESTPVPAATP
ncbi:Uncharacterised protein [Mycobacteroides abscessus subsp. abscessus]|nr:Uncharacterised protein [Mycobacteroides abscessus subsp. abscessus]